MTMILGGLTAFLTIVVIILAVKIRKPKTGTVDSVAHMYVMLRQMRDKSKVHGQYKNKDQIFVFCPLAVTEEPQSERNKVDTSLLT